MAIFDYRPLTSGIVFNFVCPECGAVNRTDVLSVPSPNILAEHQEDSINSEEKVVACNDCGHELTVEFHSGMYGGQLIVDGIDRVSEVEEIADNDEDNDVEG